MRRLDAYQARFAFTLSPQHECRLKAQQGLDLPFHPQLCQDGGIAIDPRNVTTHRPRHFVPKQRQQQRDDDGIEYR
jgi:hypothetical protein